MPQQLLLEVLRQTEQSAPAVQAAASVHCARVMAKFDKQAAEQLLERGISLAQSLPPDVVNINDFSRLTLNSSAKSLI